MNAQKLYAVAQTKTQKLWPVFLEFVTKIGQSQLIRRQIANELNVSKRRQLVQLLLMLTPRLLIFFPIVLSQVGFKDLVMCVGCDEQCSNQ
jgi:hypothetical protein